MSQAAPQLSPVPVRSLTGEAFDIMTRHVVDKAHLLRRPPEMPALVPIAAFEHT
jgi:hypothetical protein